MSNTPNSNFEHPTENTKGAAVIASEALDGFDNQRNKDSSFAITGNRTLTEIEFVQGGWITLTGTPGAPFDLNLPTNKQTFMVRNTTDDVCTVQVTGGAGVTIDLVNGRTGGFYSDGTDIFARWSSLNVGIPYQIPIWIVSQPTSLEKILFHTPATDFILPVSLTSSVVQAETAANATTTFDIKKNGSSVGSFQFAGAATVATFTFSTETKWSASAKDSFEVIAPTSVDSTLADIHGTILGYFA